MGQILIILKSITQHFAQQHLPDAFRPIYQELIQNLIPILKANLHLEDFTSQILVFYRTLLLVMGFDPSEIINHCAS